MSFLRNNPLFRKRHFFDSKLNSLRDERQSAAKTDDAELYLKKSFHYYFLVAIEYILMLIVAFIILVILFFIINWSFGSLPNYFNQLGVILLLLHLTWLTWSPPILGTIFAIIFIWVIFGKFMKISLKVFTQQKAELAIILGLLLLVITLEPKKDFEDLVGLVSFILILLVWQYIYDFTIIITKMWLEDKKNSIPKIGWMRAVSYIALVTIVFIGLVTPVYKIVF